MTRIKGHGEVAGVTDAMRSAYRNACYEGGSMDETIAAVVEAYLRGRSEAEILADHRAGGVRPESDPRETEEYRRVFAEGEAYRHELRATRQRLFELESRAPCQVPPPGWVCSRAAGHDGPCAARACARCGCGDTDDLTKKG